MDGTGKRVTRRLGGGQRSPVTRSGLGGVKGRGRGFSTVVCSARYDSLACSSRAGHRHPCATMGGASHLPTGLVGGVGAYQGTSLDVHGVGVGCWTMGWAGCWRGGTPDHGLRAPWPPFSCPRANFTATSSTAVRCYCHNARVDYRTSVSTWLLDAPGSSLGAGLDYI